MSKVNEYIGEANSPRKNDHCYFPNVSSFFPKGRLCFTSPNAAYVVNPSDGNRIFIYSKSLNRALPNDIVAVKLNDVEHWRVRLIFNYFFYVVD